MDFGISKSIFFINGELDKDEHRKVIARDFMLGIASNFVKEGLNDE